MGVVRPFRPLRNIFARKTKMLPISYLQGLYTGGMKTYPIEQPPKAPGIYVLCHRPTGKLYIGMSMNLRARYHEWRTSLTDGTNVQSPAILDAWKTTKPSEWDFSILSEFPGITKKELAHFEARAIERVKNARPTQILNTQPGYLPTVNGRQEGALPKSVVLDDAGEPMLYADAAKELGLAYETIKKKLQKLRDKGIQKVTLQELRPIQKSPAS